MTRLPTEIDYRIDDLMRKQEGRGMGVAKITDHRTKSGEERN